MSSLREMRPDRVRRGGIAIMTAVMLIGLLSVAAVVVDAGFLMASKRYCQRVADTAALAGATQMLIMASGNASNSTTTPLAATKDLIDNETGTSSGLTFVSATIRLYEPKPPTNGAASSTKSGGSWTDGTSAMPVTPSVTICNNGDVTQRLRNRYIEVTVTYRQQSYFSKVIGSGTVDITARAVARGGNGVTVDGIITTSPHAAGALTVSGGANLVVTSSDGTLAAQTAIVVNSDGTSGSSGAASTTGGSTVRAPYLQTGDASAASFDLVTHPITYGDPAPDPLANLPEPPTTGLSTISTGGNSGLRLRARSGTTDTISPGIYPHGIIIGGSGAGANADDSGTVTMQPGIYYIQDGGFSVGSQAHVIANGVLIVNMSPSGSNNGIDIGAQSTFNMTPLNLSTGDSLYSTFGDYNGIGIWSSRAAGLNVSLGAQGVFTNTGVVYAPSSDVRVTGGTSNTIGSRYISSTLAISGQGDLTISFMSPPGQGDRILSLIE